MKRYINGFRSDNVLFGEGSGAALTSGEKNVLLGPNAGSSITSGGSNVVLGGYVAEATTSRNIILSNGEGQIACRWDPSGNIIQTLNTAKTQDLRDDAVTIHYDSTNNVIIFTYRKNGVEYTSRTMAYTAVTGITTNNATLLNGEPASFYTLSTSGTGISLIKENNKLKGLIGSAPIEVIGTDANVVTISSTLTLADDTVITGTLPGNLASPNPYSLVGNSSLATGFKLRRLYAGAGISLNTDNNCVIITNASAGNAVKLRSTPETLTKPAGSVDLIPPGTVGSATSSGEQNGPNMQIYRLLGSRGVVTDFDAATNVVRIRGELTNETATGVTPFSVIGTTSPMHVKQLVEGRAISLKATDQTITIASNDFVTVPLTMKDVSATLNQFIMIPYNTPSVSLGWDGMNPSPFPVLRYQISGATHNGSVLMAVPGIPAIQNNKRWGFELSFVVDVAGWTTESFAFTMTVSIPGATWTTPKTYTQNITIASPGVGSLFQNVTFLPIASADTLSINGQNLPTFESQYIWQTMQIKLSGTTAITKNIDIYGMRLLFKPEA